MAETTATESLQTKYDRDGYCVARNVLDQNLIGEAQEHVHWLCKKHPGTRPEQLDAEMAVNDPFWIRLVSDERLLDIVEQFIGPDVALFASHYICKPPKTGQAVLWHQDGAYWPIEPMNVITLWLAVSASTPENGCLRVIPGTQNFDLKELRQRDDVESVLGSEYSGEVDESKAVDLILQPGDLSIHHPNVIHGSEANGSDMWRMGLTIRYIPTTTRVLVEKVGTPLPVMLFRGNAVEGVNDYLPKPKYIEGEHISFRDQEQWK